MYRKLFKIISFNKSTLHHPKILAIPVGIFWLLVGWLWRPIGDYGVETDFYGDFLPHARHWLSGNPDVLSGYRGPGYYLVVGVLDKLGDAFFLAKIFSSISLGCALWFLAGLVEKLENRSTAWLAMIFLAGNSVLAQQAYRAESDSFFFFIFCTILALAFNSKPSPRIWAAAGLLAGLAFLTRYNGLVLLPILLTAGLTAGISRKDRVQAIAMICGFWMMAVAPWWLFVWSKTGSPFWNLNHILIAESLYVGDPSLANMAGFQPHIGFSSLSEVFRAAPSLAFMALLRKTPGHFISDWSLLIGWVGGAVSLVGWGSFLLRRPDRTGRGFALAGILVYLSLLPVFYNPRFMLPLIPWWAFGFGQGARLILRLLPTSLPKFSTAIRSLLYMSLILWAVLMAFRQTTLIRQDLRDGKLPTPLLELANKSQRTGFEFSESTPLCARKPHLAAILDIPFIPLKGKSGFQAIKNSGASYLLVSPMEVALFPAMSPWSGCFENHPAPPGTRLVCCIQDMALFALTTPSTRPSTPPLWADSGPPDFPDLGRMDSLRLRLARWTSIWLPGNSPVRILGNISGKGREQPLFKLRMGDALLAEGRIGEARSAYESVNNAQGLPGSIHLRLALLDFMEADLAGFKNQLGEWKRLREGNHPLTVSDLVRQSVVLKNEEEYESAAALLIHVRSLDPTSPIGEDFKALGYCFLNMRKPDLAREAFQKALEKMPDDREIHLVLANDRRLNKD